MKLPLRVGPQAFTDGDGTPCVRVVLARGQGTADIDAATYERLVSAGISSHWHLNANSAGYGYVRSSHPQLGTVTVAREALSLSKGDGLMARHRNGNLRDLRKSNLYAERNPHRPLQGPRPSRAPTNLPAASSVVEHGPPDAGLQIALGRSGKFANVDPGDYQRIVSGGLERNWYAVPNGKGKHYVYAHHHRAGRTVSVAREITGLRRGDGRRVRHLDGDHFNLRRSNLVIDEPGTTKIKTQRHRS